MARWVIGEGWYRTAIPTNPESSFSAFLSVLHAREWIGGPSAQTGSGKTYTMGGDGGSVAGIYALAAREVFALNALPEHRCGLFLLHGGSCTFVVE